MLRRRRHAEVGRQNYEVEEISLEIKIEVALRPAGVISSEAIS